MTEKVDRTGPADRNDGEAGEGRHDRDHGREQVKKTVAAGGGATRLEEELQPISRRLKQSPGADAVRTRPLLHTRLDFPLEQREIGKAGQQGADHDHRLDQRLDDDLERHAFSLQSTRAPWLTAAYGGSARTRSAVIASTLS